MNKNTFALLTVAVASLVILSPKSLAYGSDSSSSSNSMPQAASCTADTPARPVLFQPNHPTFGHPTTNGEVYLRWTKTDRANGYQIFYGFSSRNYIYSVPATGDTTEYTIKGLNPRIPYYFAVKAMNGCQSSVFSNEWSNKVNLGTFNFTGGNTVLGARTVATGGAVITPMVTPSEVVTPIVIQNTPANTEVVNTDDGFFAKIWRAITNFFK